MMNHKVESEANFSTYDAKSESAPGKKRLKKVRSIRLLRLSSMRSSTRGGKSQCDNLSMLSSPGTVSSLAEMSDASPNYMKATSSSHAKESFQNTQTLPQKTLTRISTLKLKRSVSRKLSGRAEVKRKLKSSRSIKVATVKDQKSTRNLSESIHGSDGQNRKSTSDNAGNKSQRVITRRLSFKPLRILTTMPTFKSKNDSSLHKATCSSTLKDSHFPDHIDLPQEGSSPGEASAVKVCPYSYCSLHGHRHDNVPPLKRFVSVRRRMLRTQKSLKMDGRPVTRSKRSGNARKATQKNQTVHSGDGTGHSKHMKKMARDSCTITSTVTQGEEKYSFRDDAEVLPGETSLPDMINLEEHLNNYSLAVEGDTSLAINETNMACCCIAIEKDKFDSVVTETAACNKNDENAIVESISADVVKSSASDIQLLEGEATTKAKNMEPKPASTNDVAYRMQEKDQKYVRMWQLMYKHAMSGNKGKEKQELSFDGKDKEQRGQDAQSFGEVSSYSSQDLCEADQDMDDKNKNVIDMVQKAFDEILLPEPEGLSSDDDSKSSGIGSDEVLEMSEGNGEEANASAFRESPKEEAWLKDGNFRSHAAEITAPRMGTKPDQKTPKSWSNLKKLILMRRFVKALDKVRNFNLRRSRHLPSDAKFEAEKVSLKHLTAEESKNSEEWMLDYALQKVISRLAPAQRQKVALLVEAFETVLPFQDAENAPKSSATPETQANPILSLDDSLYHSKEETEKGTANNDDSEEKISIDNDNIHHADIKDSRSWSLSKPAEIIGSYDEEALADKIVKEVPEDLISTSNTEISSSKSESAGTDFETKNLIGANGEQFSMSKNLILKGLMRSLGSNFVGSGAPSDLLDEPTSDRKEKAKLQTESLEGLSTQKRSEAAKSAVVEPETKLEKQNYTGLWYLVYKHMVSDMTENDSKSQTDGANKEESGYEGTRTRGTPVMNQDMQFKDHSVADSEVELQQIEAIKMVEEAIDSILPDVQDHSSDNTVTDNCFNPSSGAEGLNQIEERIASRNGITQEQEKEESASKEGNKPNQQLPRSWSNLKKVILLRRFIKALEKVRKFNPRGPRFLPIEPDPEAEKVNLRHQDMAERKGTEEWMLDYALRQVVSQLTPARKRKVGLLVEAFETVMPTIKS